MLLVDKISKKLGRSQVVDRVSMDLSENSVVGFLGPNGAGKSTTMRMVAGYLLPDMGTVRICNHDIINDRLKAQLNLGYLPEAPCGFEKLTVREFLTFCCECRNIKGAVLKEAIVRTCEKIDLGPALDLCLGQLSKGWRQRAWLGQAIIHEPKVLVLDEPTDGLDPNQKDQIRKVIQEMSTGRTIILSTHILEEAEELCERVIVITMGRIVADDKINKLTDVNNRLGETFRRLTLNKNIDKNNHSIPY